MMHGEDVSPPNETTHAYHLSITYNGCEFCLLTPPVIIALSPNAYFKDGVCKFLVSFASDHVLIIAIKIVR